MSCRHTDRVISGAAVLPRRFLLSSARDRRAENVRAIYFRISGGIISRRAKWKNLVDL